MLKKIALLLMLILPMSVFAQKFGHIKTQEILIAMPEYTKAQTDIQTMQQQYDDEMKRLGEELNKKFAAYQQANNELELASQQFQKAIEAKAKEAETLYLAYQKASNSLSATQRTQKEEAIVAKEKEVAELRRMYFGPEGEMAKKEDALIAPIQNRIYEVVKQISMQKGYDAVIDRASATSVIFASPRIDISNEVLTKLGYSN